MELNKKAAYLQGLVDGLGVDESTKEGKIIKAMAALLGEMADAIAAMVKKSLKGVKLAAYYGCLMSRPPEIMDFGDPENPTLMESLLSACGAEMLDFPAHPVFLRIFR